MGSCSHCASSSATAAPQHPELARTQESSLLPSGQVLVMEQGEASLVVPWLEKMLSSRLIGGLLKGQEELMVLLCPDFSVAQGFCICCQQHPLVSFGARRGVPDLSLFEGNLRSLLLLALAGIDQAAGGTKGIIMRRKGREGVWHRIPLPITGSLLSMVHGSLLKASEAKQNSGAEYPDSLPDVSKDYVMGDTACLALRVSLSGFGTTTTK